MEYNNYGLCLNNFSEFKWVLHLELYTRELKVIQYLIHFLIIFIRAIEIFIKIYANIEYIYINTYQYNLYTQYEFKKCLSNSQGFQKILCIY